jgi:ABC-type xylose transport system substrate-binding protein
MKLSKTLLAGVAFAAMAMASGANAADMKIALVVKSLGNGFFEAANKGAEEAAKELGGVEIIYTGPTTTTAEGQIEVINSLIAQGVDAIAISANDRTRRSGAEEGPARHQGHLLGFGRCRRRPHHAPQPVVQRTDRQDVPAARGQPS